MNRSAPLDRRTPLRRGKPLARSTKPAKRQPVSPASKQQRAKVAERACIVCGEGPATPAHLWDRSLGGCDSSYCVAPLCPRCHNAYDLHELDVLGSLLGLGMVAEIIHALAHARGDLIGLVNRLTGDCYIPDSERSRA